MEEIRIEQEFALENGVVDGTHANELYRLLNATIEQYRRQEMKKIYPKMGHKTILELDKGEPHLNLHGPLHERLVKIIENEGNFLARILY